MPRFLATPAFLLARDTVLMLQLSSAAISFTGRDRSTPVKEIAVFGEVFLVFPRMVLYLATVPAQHPSSSAMAALLFDQSTPLKSLLDITFLHPFDNGLLYRAGDAPAFFAGILKKKARETGPGRKSLRVVIQLPASLRRLRPRQLPQGRRPRTFPRPTLRGELRGRWRRSRRAIRPQGRRCRWRGS